MATLERARKAQSGSVYQLVFPLNDGQGLSGIEAVEFEADDVYSALQFARSKVLASSFQIWRDGQKLYDVKIRDGVWQFKP